VKEKKPEVQPTADPEKTQADPVIQISDIKVVVQDKGKKPMVFSKSATSLAEEPVMANDHEAGSSKMADKYHQPRWCPEGLTHTQKRKLQHLRNKEKREQEAERMRDEHFNKYRPMMPQGKVWQVMTIDQPIAGPVEPTPATSQTSTTDRSDRHEQPFRPVQPCAKSTAQSAAPVSASRVDEVPLVPPAMEDEELVDYEASPERNNLEINVVHMSLDYLVVPKEEVAHLQFGPRDAVFQKPKESKNHLKALYMRGHVNGKPISRMLVDGGAIINLMPYLLYKKLGGKDEELIKTNMTVNGVGGGDPISAKGVASMELTIGSKTLATSFFISEVQGNFSLIFGRDWIRANQYVPSTLHQFLI
jgi:hypothetical protein